MTKFRNLNNNNNKK